jgi:hypothetical protein
MTSRFIFVSVQDFLQVHICERAGSFPSLYLCACRMFSRFLFVSVQDVCSVLICERAGCLIGYICERVGCIPVSYL